jgi:hypothetical protein
VGFVVRVPGSFEGALEIGYAAPSSDLRNRRSGRSRPPGGTEAEETKKRRREARSLFFCILLDPPCLGAATAVGTYQIDAATNACKEQVTPPPCKRKRS